MLVEHAEADPVLRKELRILVAGTEGAGKLAAEIDKRIQTIGRSRSFLDCDRCGHADRAAKPSPSHQVLDRSEGAAGQGRRAQWAFRIAGPLT